MKKIKCIAHISKKEVRVNFFKDLKWLRKEIPKLKVKVHV